MNAATFAIDAGIVALVPRVRFAAGGVAERRWPALRDRPYLTVAFLSGVLGMHNSVLTILLPLWIAQRTAVPPALMAVMVLVNTALVVVFQVIASRGAEEPSSAARHQRRAALAIAAACGLFAAAQGRAVWAAVAVLITGVLFLTIGELWHSAGAWGLSFGLAPLHRQGQYQAAFGLGFAAETTLGPLLVVALGIGLGLPGWLALAAIFVACGLAIIPAAEWAIRHRPHDEPVTAPAAQAASVEPSQR